jgi:hypothetical protein
MKARTGAKKVRNCHLKMSKIRDVSLTIVITIEGGHEG